MLWVDSMPHIATKKISIRLDKTSSYNDQKHISENHSLKTKDVQAYLQNKGQ